MKSPYWYAGPMIWDESIPTMPHWRGPSEAVGMLDLRAIPHMATAGGSPQGQSVFLADGPIADSSYTLLGTGHYRDVKTSQALRDRMPKRDKKRDPQGDDLLSHLLDTLTDGSDPTGDSFAKPIMPDGAMKIVLNIGPFNHQWKTAPWAYHWDKIQDVERADFQRCFDDSQAGRLNDREHHRRVLDFLCDKYNAQGPDDWKAFVPQKLRKSIPGRLKHETTITEDFTRADSASAIGNLLTWTQLSGTWGTTSNAGYKSATSAVQQLARAESDLSSADHYVQVTLVNSNGNAFTYGPVARFSASAQTGYTTYGFPPNVYAAKVVAGTETLMASAPRTYANGDVVKITVTGSSIVVNVNGSNVLSPTDTAVTGNLRTGMRSYYSNAIFDDFVASDGGPSGTNYTQLERSTRGILRGVYTHY